MDKVVRDAGMVRMTWQHPVQYFAAFFLPAVGLVRWIEVTYCHHLQGVEYGGFIVCGVTIAEPVYRLFVIPGPCGVVDRCPIFVADGQSSGVVTLTVRLRVHCPIESRC